MQVAVGGAFKNTLINEQVTISLEDNDTVSLRFTLVQKISQRLERVNDFLLAIDKNQICASISIHLGKAWMQLYCFIGQTNEHWHPFLSLQEFTFYSWQFRANDLVSFLPLFFSVTKPVTKPSILISYGSVSQTVGHHESISNRSPFITMCIFFVVFFLAFNIFFVVRLDVTMVYDYI